MPRLKENAVPSYRLHKQSGQAIVTLSGHDHLLGSYGTKASRDAYDRAIAEWRAAGRVSSASSVEKLKVAHLIDAFWEHAKTYYGKSSELVCFKYALRPLRKLYDDTPAADFGPLKLKAVQQEMVAQGRSRGYVNKSVGRIKRVFKWGVVNEMVDPSVFHGLRAVEGLKEGRSNARETESVRPVPEPVLGATLPHLSPTVRAMVELQLLTGMRPGEVCMMRTCDIDITGKLWIYTPAKHKTKHFGHTRTIYLGPKAQEVLRPFLRHDLSAYCFSPAEAERERRRLRHEARRTPIGYGNTVGTNRVRNPQRRPGDRYDVTAYRRAVARACDVAFPAPEPLRPALKDNGRRERRREFRSRLTSEQKRDLKRWQRAQRWHPHQLRHNAATWLRKEYGLEAAQVILGHKTLTVTQVYAEKNVQAAQRIMGEVG